MRDYCNRKIISNTNIYNGAHCNIYNACVNINKVMSKK